MPTILRTGTFRFYFFSSDRDEPLHVHVEHGGCVAKFWVEPVRLERSGGFRPQELLEIQRIVEDNKGAIIRSWHEFFGN